MTKRPLGQLPGYWVYQNYRNQIYTTLAQTLRVVDVEEFDSLITESISFA
ncbi:UNVERIFIED_CONTAM: hypothetical protein FKN15_026509 [Acipenser sinensis]